MSSTNFEKFQACLNYFSDFDIENFRKKQESGHENNVILVSKLIKILENVKMSAKLLLKSVDLIFENESIYSYRIKKSIKTHEKFLKTSSSTKIEIYLFVIKEFFLDFLSFIFASKKIFLNIISNLIF